MPSPQSLGPYLLDQRVGASVWLAHDTRNGKPVAVKVLARQMPLESTRRDALIRDVRVSAALYHAFLVPITAIETVDESLVMVMDVLEAEPADQKFGRGPFDRAEFFRLAFQLASVVKFLHMKGITHGNINGDSVMVTADGQVKLGGLNASNLTRRDHASTAYQQKGSDLRCVSYMAPEQIAAQTADHRSDVFSIGAVLYGLATARLPFTGSSAADVARAIVEGQPVSPKSVHPSVDADVVSTLASCLFKDPLKRQADVKTLVESIERAEPEAARFAQQFDSKPLAAPVAAAVERRRSVLLVSDVADYQAIVAADQDGAAKAVARMQQIVGEAVYLFGGRIIDPFGTRTVAELPSVENAIEAARKAEFDLAEAGADSDPLRVRLLLHAGEIEVADGTPQGPAVEKAFAALAELDAGVVFISEEFVKEGRGSVRMRDAGARAGLKLYTIVPAELRPVTDEATAEAEEELAAAEAAAVVDELLASAQRRFRRLGAAAAVVVVALLGAAGASMWKRGGVPVSDISSAASLEVTAPPTATNPRNVFVAPFVIESSDAAVRERAEAARLGSIAILRTFPEFRVVDAAAPGVMTISARITGGPADAQIVVTSSSKMSSPSVLGDSGSGIDALVRFAIREATAPQRTLANAGALNSFAAALLAQSQDDTAAADRSLRAAVSTDPTFVAAHLLAMEFFAAHGRASDALDAARRVATLDPSNVDAPRKVARASLIGGDLAQAFAFYALILSRNASDAEALNHVARYAAAAGDAARFNAAVARLAKLPSIQVAAHEPDLLAASGRLDAAVQRYYALEDAAPQDAALALKIGRLAILRHSLPIANIQLQKLERLDPLYGHKLLSAYIAAEQQQKSVAERHLNAALAAATPGDDSWTAAAEVHAILADTPAVVAALEKAAQRKEPTAAYVVANPIFRYLQNDARFISLREKLTAQQAEIRTALAQIAL